MKTDFRISPVGGFSSENTGISSGRESGALVEMSPPFFLGGKAFSFGLTISVRYQSGCGGLDRVGFVTDDGCAVG